MRRGYITIATLVIIVLCGIMIAGFDGPSSPGQPNLAQMSQIMELHGNPTRSQLSTWNIPLEPAAGQPEQHTHAALRIYWNGAAWPAPAGLGISADGKKLALHTHAADAVVHFHKPPGHQPFTLRQILEVWGLPLKDDLFNGQPLVVWKNARIWTNGLDAAIPNKADLVVEIGASSKRDPLLAFDWKKIPLNSSN